MSTKDPNQIYSYEWFDNFKYLREEFKLVAAGIERWRLGRGYAANCFDVGCGPGVLLDELHNLGWTGKGFDGSSHSIAWAKKHVQDVVPYIWQADITTLPSPGYSPEIVICTEVAEHLEAELAPLLVRYLTAIADKCIIFTAAPKNQGGHDHVNEQPKEYWLNLFCDYGFVEDLHQTQELKARWSKLGLLAHMQKNVAVLT